MNRIASLLLVLMAVSCRLAVATEAEVIEPADPTATMSVDDEASPPRAWGVKDDKEHHVSEEVVHEEALDEARDHTHEEPPPRDTTEASAPQQPRRWGTHSPEAEAATIEEASNETKNASTQSTDNNTQHTIPFLTKKKRVDPPAGYKMVARVFIDPHDKHAHFDFNVPLIPYFDCSSTGLTTTQIPLQHATMRHSLAHTHSRAFARGNMHPIILLALNPCIVDLNSGESLTLQAGQMILLEDVLKPGHSLSGLDDYELSVLFLTLPITHHHVGKSNLCLERLQVLDKDMADPCPVDNQAPVSASTSTSRRLPASSRTARTLAWGLIGLSLSTLAADFLGKTAPLWLAVGVGGTCFVAGTTYVFVTLAERLYQEMELLLEQRKLAQSDDGP